MTVPIVRDAVVVGGGPAGLAVAIAAASHGLDVLVLERGALPADKACGEGILPAGVRALDELGVRVHLDPAQLARLDRIRWIDEQVVADALLPHPGGLGIRRTALSTALLARARAAGVEVRTGTPVLAHERGAGSVAIVTPAGTYRARVLVAADGLHSAIRKRERLETSVEGASQRIGLRRHFACPPWSSGVEVHFGAGAEAYVTPVGPDRVGVAILCEGATRASYPTLLRRFPEVERRLARAVPDSPPAGAGPFPQTAAARALDRLVLVGDAAGFVDGITGDGLSLAFLSALGLARSLSGAIRAGATRASFSRWELEEQRRFARYAVTTRAVLRLARRVGTRRRTLRFLSRHPQVLDSLVGAVVS